MPTNEQLLNIILELRNENAVKVPKPDLYYGDRKKTQAFITQLDDYIHFTRGDFASPADQVLYASTYLRGSAEQWFRPFKREYQEKPQYLWSETTTVVFSDYRNFTKQLKGAFSGIDETRLATPYTAEGHSDLTLRTFYYQGLKDEIKEAMTYHEEPETLNDMIKLAVLMDKRALATPKKEATPWNSTPPKRENKAKKGSEVDANGPKKKRTSTYRVKENQIHWRRRIRRGQWTQWKNATFSLEEWDEYVSQELIKARVPYVFPANEDIQPVAPATYGIYNAPRDLRHISLKN
ncbi:putative retrotransposon gag protein [Botryosphaeria dothidea]|uniref:Retrotransposon gag protein n=1 Tax=Botryosphaeria dothidea TaxID=55169 RepID=A0A8H4J2P4_9PEZI|nr:putative retrotransposon gag protein [Botryosphaeria dothidea]